MISLVTGVASCMPSEEVMAASIPVYHDIPPYQQKDVFATETVKIQGITVNKVVNDTVSPMVTSVIQEPVNFVIYNSTKQLVEQRVTSENGVLPELNLVKNHNYIIIAEDSKYSMSNVYVWVKNDKIVDIKKNVDTYNYPKVDSLILYEREAEEPDPASENRVTINLPVQYGTAPRYGVKFKLISAVETIEVDSVKDRLRAYLIEDITYMVVADDENYAVESLALSVKDKSEYGAGKYTYNHANCNRIEAIQLVDKKDEHKNDTSVDSISGKTTVTGISFKDFLVMEKELDKSLVTGLDSNDYTVLDIKVINPHRWEVSKLATGEFPTTVKIDKDKTVTNVYFLDGENQLQPIEFEQNNNRVSFTMHSMSIYPVVIEYESGSKEPEEPATKVGEWRYDSIGWWYRYLNGSYPYSKWDLIDGEWYYFNESGYRVTGWKKINSTWYYFDTDGMMLADEWVDNHTYYLKPDGAMATGWILLDGNWYYLNRSGAMMTGWQSVDGSWYYMDETTGIMAANRWVDNLYYVTGTGAMATGWIQLPDGWYYLNSSGAKVTNRWMGNYYLKEDGLMATSEWVDNDRYYVDGNGAWVPGASK